MTFSERFEGAPQGLEPVSSSGIAGSVKWCRLWDSDCTVEGDRAHLAGGEGRPDWPYDWDVREASLTDIASHQIDQFLWSTGSTIPPK